MVETLSERTADGKAQTQEGKAADRIPDDSLLINFVLIILVNVLVGGLLDPWMIGVSNAAGVARSVLTPACTQAAAHALGWRQGRPKKAEEQQQKRRS